MEPTVYCAVCLMWSLCMVSVRTGSPGAPGKPGSPGKP